MGKAKKKKAKWLKKQREGKRPHNWLALFALLHGGAGPHDDNKRAQTSKKKCREKVDY